MTRYKLIHVLLVEDDDGDAGLVQAALLQSREAQFEVTWVKSINQAQQCLLNCYFDALLLDLSLPDSYGIATLHRIRQLSGLIPVIILTGSGDTDFALTALEAGASDYMIKSDFGSDGLTRAIRYALLRADMEAHNRLLVTALESAADGIFITDRDGRIEWVNPAFTRLTGYSNEDALGQKHADLAKPNWPTQPLLETAWQNILPGEHWHGETVNKRKDGSQYHEDLTIAPVFDEKGQIKHFIGIKKDVTERRQMEENLKRLASTDPLTGLPNRRVFMEALAQEWARLQRFNNMQSSLLMLDIDYFKRINDTYGHAAGDEVLCQFADILRDELRNIDTPGRLGGEEFAILLPGIAANNAMTMAERLRKRIEATPVISSNGLINFTVSIGVTLIGAEDMAYEAALHRADAAMYNAKDAGRNQTKWQ